MSLFSLKSGAVALSATSAKASEAFSVYLSVNRSETPNLTELYYVVSSADANARVGGGDSDFKFANPTLRTGPNEYVGKIDLLQTDTIKLDPAAGEAGESDELFTIQAYQDAQLTHPIGEPFYVTLTDTPLVDGSRSEDLNIDNLTTRDQSIDISLTKLSGKQAVTGYYRAVTADGGVIDPTSNLIIKPGDAGYSEAALSIQNRLKTFDAQNISEGSLKAELPLVDGYYAPFAIITDGLRTENCFAYSAANLGNAERFRVQDNSFLLELDEAGKIIQLNDFYKFQSAASYQADLHRVAPLLLSYFSGENSWIGLFFFSLFAENAQMRVNASKIELAKINFENNDYNDLGLSISRPPVNVSPDTPIQWQSPGAIYADAEILITDENGVNLLLDPSQIPLDLDQAQTAKSLYLSLGYKPSEDVTVYLRSSEANYGLLRTGDNTSAAVAKFVFTPQNWDAPRAFIVQGVSTSDAGLDHPFQIVSEITTSDISYKQLQKAGTAALSFVTQKSNAVGLDIASARAQDGRTSSLSVRLLARPSTDVFVEVRGTSAGFTINDIGVVPEPSHQVYARELVTGS